MSNLQRLVGRPAAGVGPALALLVAAFVLLPPVASSFSPVPNDVDFLVLSEDFEKSFPGTNWTVTDSDPASGTDMWGSSSARAFAGNGSAWSAALGNRSYPVSAWSEDFDGANVGANWTFAQDSNMNYGYDRWGISNYRANSGNASVWNARVGTQSSGGQNNSAVHLYDGYMNASFYRSVNLTGWSSATLSYWYWINTQPSSDNLYAAYDDGGWVYASRYNGNQAALGWQQATVSIPATASRVGFFFINDCCTNSEGAYIDDVSVYGLRTGLNRQLATYDTSMNATMSRGVDVGAFAQARVEYRYWMETDSAAETLQAGYFFAGNWTFPVVHNGTSGGWQSSTMVIDTNATLIGFRFTTDGTGLAEGAYIDDVKVWGSVRALTCSASVTVFTGMEAVTPYLYFGSAAEGMRPYSWSWSFGDGTSSTAQNPAHLYGDVGTYSATLTARDASGQVCSSTAAGVTVTHDLTRVSVSPVAADAVEGQSFLVSGGDGQGHPYPLDWAVDPPTCGALDTARGTRVTFTASVEAGGQDCRLQGRLGSMSANATLHIRHDTSVVALAPFEPTLVEGGSLAFSAADAQGHALTFRWAASCGQLSPDTGPSTVYRSTTTGGTDCTVAVTAEALDGGGSASTPVTIVHDASRITITPTSAAVVEGQEVAFAAVDVYSHPFAALWTVEPPTCGAFSLGTGTASRFTASQSAGGLACTVAAGSPANRANATVTVYHDTSTATLTPSSSTPLEGTDQVFSVTDSLGHPVAVTFSLGPASCGNLSTTQGSSTTVSISPEAGGTGCTLQTSGLGLNLGASISVLHLDAASVRVSLSATEATEGSSITATAAVLDSLGHLLSGLAAVWSATCGEVSSASGPSRTLTLPDDAGASPECTVTATHAAFSGSATVTLTHGGPYTVAVEPAAPSVGGGGTQVLLARVTDVRGHGIFQAPVRWTATCGVLSSETGPSVVYTAPGELGGTTCQVSAVYESLDGLSDPARALVSVPMSLLLPIGVLVPLAGVGSAVFLVVKRRRGSREIADAEGRAAPPAPGAEAGLAGWASAAPLGAPAHGSGEPITVWVPALPPESKATAGEPPAKPPAKVSVRPVRTAPGKPGPMAPVKRIASVPPKTPAAPKPPVAQRPASALAPPPPPVPPVPALAEALPSPPSPPRAPEALAAVAQAPAEAQPQGAPGEAPCPSCSKPVEVGWAACPECGLDLVWN